MPNAYEPMNTPDRKGARGDEFVRSPPQVLTPDIWNYRDSEELSPPRPIAFDGKSDGNLVRESSGIFPDERLGAAIKVLLVGKDANDTRLMHRTELLTRAQEYASSMETHFYESNDDDHSERPLYFTRAVSILSKKDLRLIDPVYNAVNQPGVLARKQAVLFNLEPIRALVFRDALMVILSTSPSVQEEASDQLFETKTRWHDHTQAYEIRKLWARMSLILMAYEMILNAVHLHWRRHVQDLEADVEEALSALHKMKALESEKIGRLKTLNGQVLHMDSKLSEIITALTKLSDDFEETQLLYLTELYDNPWLYEDRLETEEPSFGEVELLLEAYIQDIQSLKSRAILLRLAIGDTEDLLELRLDYARNCLIRVVVVMNVITVSMTFISVATSSLGMNIKINAHDYAFGDDGSGLFWSIVAVMAAVFMGLSGFFLYLFYRRGVIY